MWLNAGREGSYFQVGVVSLMTRVPFDLELQMRHDNKWRKGAATLPVPFSISWVSYIYAYTL